MIEMARREIIPAVSEFLGELSNTVSSKKNVNGNIPSSSEIKLIEKLSALNDLADAAVEKLESDLKKVTGDKIAQAQYMAHNIIPDMESLRSAVDEMEKLTYSKYWCMPTYFDILYSV